MEFWVTPSFCLWELMFSLGRENTLWDVVCLGWAAKLNAALRRIVIPFFLWRDFCQLEKGGGFPLPSSLPNLFAREEGREVAGLSCSYYSRTNTFSLCLFKENSESPPLRTIPHILAWVQGRGGSHHGGVHNLHATAVRMGGKGVCFRSVARRRMGEIGGWAACEQAKRLGLFT